MKVFNIEFNVEDLSTKGLIQFAETTAVTANILKEYFVISILEDENVLSKICETAGVVGDSLKSAALEDLNCMWKALTQNPIEGYIPSVKRKLVFGEYQKSLETVVASETPVKMLDAVISHYSTFGAGENARYIAFRWQNGLNRVEAPDDIILEHLFCLDEQKDMLTENTLLFLRGLPANNVLLYGDSGSGKSSMVKALLNKYYGHGLRLIEISKTDLDELPQLVECVKNKRQKYIVFMDDLSFEVNDTGYKNLKVLLDGQIEKQPKNILLYATSNRFHLINESWKDRQGDEVHFRDTINEKISLSERFGIRIDFVTSRLGEEYFKIIAGILSKENIPFTDEVRKQAVEWERSYNGRSGRTAARFARKIISDKWALEQ